jgi:hypothetical protein
LRASALARTGQLHIAGASAVRQVGSLITQQLCGRAGAKPWEGVGGLAGLSGKGNGSGFAAAGMHGQSGRLAAQTAGCQPLTGVADTRLVRTLLMVLQSLMPLGHRTMGGGRGGGYGCV